jgi:hypothetical protein
MTDIFDFVTPPPPKAALTMASCSTKVYQKYIDEINKKCMEEAQNGYLSMVLTNEHLIELGVPINSKSFAALKYFLKNEGYVVTRTYYSEKERKKNFGDQLPPNKIEISWFNLVVKQEQEQKEEQISSSVDTLKIQDQKDQNQEEKQDIPSTVEEKKEKKKKEDIIHPDFVPEHIRWSKWTNVETIDDLLINYGIGNITDMVTHFQAQVAKFQEAKTKRAREKIALQLYATFIKAERENPESLIRLKGSFFNTFINKLTQFHEEGIPWARMVQNELIKIKEKHQ